MLTDIGRRFLRVARCNPWGDVLGVSRSILASSCLITLICNRSDILFRPVAGIPVAPICSGLRKVSAFCAIGRGDLDVARMLCILGLLVVVSGWRPRVTGILHAWIAFSFQGSATLVDGGDQLHSIVALLLVPVTLTDNRRWHWSAPEQPVKRMTDVYRRVIALVPLSIIRAQVAIVYLHASIGKAKSEEWANGTALYYWLQSPDFGAPGWLAPLLKPILLSGPAVALATWSIIGIELALAAGLIASRRARPWLLCAGIALHVGIVVIHGLVSFGLVMIGSLILFLRPVDESFGIALKARALVSFVRAPKEPVPSI